MQRIFQLFLQIEKYNEEVKKYLKTTLCIFTFYRVLFNYDFKIELWSESGN